MLSVLGPLGRHTARSAIRGTGTFAAGRLRRGKSGCPRTALPPIAHRDRRTGRFPMGGLGWGCPLSHGDIFLVLAKQEPYKESKEDSSFGAWDGFQMVKFSCHDAILSTPPLNSRRERPNIVL